MSRQPRWESPRPSAPAPDAGPPSTEERPIRCPACGRENPPERLFCSACAAELVPGAAAETEPPRARGRLRRRLHALHDRLREQGGEVPRLQRQAREGLRRGIPAPRRVLVTLASLAPGLGHWFLGRPRPGLVLAGVFWCAASLWFAFIGTALAGLMALAAVAALYVSIVDCVRRGLQGEARPLRASHLWLGLTVMLVGYALALAAAGHWWQQAAIQAEVFRLAPPGRAAGPRLVFAPGDRLLVATRAYLTRAPERGEVILARLAGDEAELMGLDARELLQVQRIIGVPGDLVEVRNGLVWLNGRPLPEESYPLQPRLQLNAGQAAARVRWETTAMRVPDGHFLVWGAGRQVQLGPAGAIIRAGPELVQRDQIGGRVWAVYFPYTHRRIVNHRDPVLARRR